MLNISTKINDKGILKWTDVHCPEDWEEVSVEQFQKIVSTWDGVDFVVAFSILSGLEINDIALSKDHKLETAMYHCIQFLFTGFDQLERLPLPRVLMLRPIWQKDCPLLVDEVIIPKHIGRLSIGQNIQARKSLEGVKDIREGISIITAIYLQPLIDKGKYDHLRAIELEQIILKMPITKIFGIGFFLLRRLNANGSWLTIVLNLWRRTRIKKGRRLRS